LHKTLRVTVNSSAHHQEPLIVHSALVCVIHALKTAYGQDQNGTETVVKTCLIQTSAEYTVRNSWWCTEELSETCRFLCRNKFEILVHLVCFIEKKFITMHAHMNVEVIKMRFSIEYMRLCV